MITLEKMLDLCYTKKAGFYVSEELWQKQCLGSESFSAARAESLTEH